MWLELFYHGQFKLGRDHKFTVHVHYFTLYFTMSSIFKIFINCNHGKNVKKCYETKFQKRNPHVLIFEFFLKYFKLCTDPTWGGYLRIYLRDPSFLKGSNWYVYGFDKRFFKISWRANTTLYVVSIHHILQWAKIQIYT